MEHGPDAHSDNDEPATDTAGGQEQEKVEDRPNVSTTTPDQYRTRRAARIPNSETDSAPSVERHRKSEGGTMSGEREGRVRDLAHSLWEGEGRPEGRALHHWLSAERETGGDANSRVAHPDDIDRAAGPSHGDEDFGGHDAESEGSAGAGVGGEQHSPGTAPKQAGTDEAEVGEKRASSGLPDS